MARIDLALKTTSNNQFTASNPGQAMSDGEAVAGEMSDGAGGNKKRFKIRLGGSGSPSGSRAGSPENPSRAASPASVGGSHQSKQSQAVAIMHRRTFLCRFLNLRRQKLRRPKTD